MTSQLSLAGCDKGPRFPSTRYQGSKAKLVDWIWENVSALRFDTALDAFGGTGSVTYLFKQKGKQVTYNDLLRFNAIMGLALIENDHVRLTQGEIDLVLADHRDASYPTFIQDTFQGIYFTDDENRWLDRVVANIQVLEDPIKRAIAYFALFQTCAVKRPFNLFHRKNLYLRTADVKRNFGNKASWERPCEEWFRRFVDEANSAVFSNGRENRDVQGDAVEVDGDFDLVYIDPPYVSAHGMGVDYHHFYHFLEGIADYAAWPERLDLSKKHRPLASMPSPWTDKNRIHDAFDRLFHRFQDSILVVSYRDDGIPSAPELAYLLGKYKKQVVEARCRDYRYALSTRKSAEMLLIGV